MSTDDPEESTDSWAREVSRRFTLLQDELKAIRNDIVSLRLEITKENQHHQVAMLDTVHAIQVRLTGLEIREKERHDVDRERRDVLVTTLSNAKTERQQLASKYIDLAVRSSGIIALLGFLLERLGLLP